MNTVKCRNCGHEIEISAALQGQIEEQVIKAEHAKHEAELAKVREESAKTAQKQLDEAITQAKTKLASDQETLVKNLQQDAAEEKENNKKLRAQLSELMQELREERKAKENAELDMQKKLTEEEGKIRAAAAKEADEKQRLNLAARDKTIADLQKSLDEAQRKAAQGSQQLQGEIMELDLEEALAGAFRDDDIEPVAKGVRGGDIRQVVKSPRGTVCGAMLWEIKRTKNWTEGWISKLKEDLRSEKANVPIIVSEVLPKHITEDMGFVSGVWVCKPKLAIILATLLRKSLLDAGLQKALAENRGTKAEALFGFITSHEFVQQIESMVETYQEMTIQLSKEKVAMQKIWAQREAQSQRLLASTANIVGSMQGHVGHTAMPRIKGLELLEAENETV
jgi:hypothetical protein